MRQQKAINALRRSFCGAVRAWLGARVPGRLAIAWTALLRGPTAGLFEEARVSMGSATVLEAIHSRAKLNSNAAYWQSKDRHMLQYGSIDVRDLGSINRCGSLTASPCVQKKGMQLS